MQDKNGKESRITRWIDDQGQMQIVKSHSQRSPIKSISIFCF